MYFAEHRFLGDSLRSHSNDPSPQTTHAVPTTLVLENGLEVTYGEINGFAGDYFGFDRPMSLESDMKKMKDIFQRWFDLLGYSPGGKTKAEAISKELKPVNDQADQVLRSQSQHGTEDLAGIYKNNTLDVWHLDNVTKDPKWANGASFMQLLETNSDHFGAEARGSYNAGHALAIDLATQGQLEKALAVNAFADHFLQDSFAAGHMRVPRKDIARIAQHTVSLIPYFDKLVNASANVSL
jgi:hypothetical protein